jgi:hypothetical protein
MSNVVKYETATGYVKEYLLSVNDPDYESPQPPYSFLNSPDVSALASIPIKYWKVVDGIVVEMSAAEKQALDDLTDQTRVPRNYPIYSISPLMFYTCDNADWPINRAVTVLNDPVKTAIKVFQLDNGINTGIGYNFVFR